MPKEVFDKQLGAWLEPEEEVAAIKKRAETEGRRLTDAETEYVGYLQGSVKERQVFKRENARKKEERGAIAPSPETAELRRKADAAREEEKRNFQGGQYL